MAGMAGLMPGPPPSDEERWARAFAILRDHEESVPGWQEFFGGCLTVAGLLLTLPAVVLACLSLRRQLGAHRRAPTSVLTRGQCQDLDRQVQGRRPPDLDHLPVARDVVRRRLTLRWLIVVMAGGLPGQAGSFLSSPSTWRLPLLLVTSVCSTAVALVLLLQMHRARKFLTQYPGPAAPTHPATG